MILKRIAIELLNVAYYNPRRELKPGDPTFEKLKRSIDTFGCVEPIIVNERNDRVVGGHQRLAVLRNLGHTEVDVVFVDLPLEQEKALNLALNKIIGDWDRDKLAVLLQELSGFPDVDVELTGFDGGEIADLVTGLLDQGAGEGADEFLGPDDSQPAVTQPGDLLELGEHRLLCGDSTIIDDVIRLMNDERAVLFATDPPYLVNYDGTNHPGSSKRDSRRKNKDWSGSYGITWDDADANPDLYDKFCAVAVERAITKLAAWYCWHASRRQAMVEAVWNQHGAFVHQQIIWVKDRPILTHSRYLWQHEPCFVGWVRPNEPRRVSREFLSTVWQIPTVPVGQPTDHPTSKPVELFAIPMRQHTRRGEICYEPFCGSGTQIIAAESLGRRCYALEISPHYCDVIVRRWIRFVGADKAPADLVERYQVDTEVLS